MNKFRHFNRIMAHRDFYRTDMTGTFLFNFLKLIFSTFIHFEKNFIDIFLNIYLQDITEDNMNILLRLRCAITSSRRMKNSWACRTTVERKKSKLYDYFLDFSKS